MDPIDPGSMLLLPLLVLAKLLISEVEALEGSCCWNIIEVEISDFRRLLTVHAAFSTMRTPSAVLDTWCRPV